VKQRTERLSAEIQAVLGEALARGAIKDPRVRDAGLVTITRVIVTGDLREARVAFTAFGATDDQLKRLQQGLSSASAFLRRELGQHLRTRNTPSLSFEVDVALDQALKVGSLLREVEEERKAVAAREAAEAAARGEANEGAAGGPETAGGDDGEDEDANGRGGGGGTG